MAVDALNLFPNSKMAAAVKAGASRMVAADQPSHVVVGEQNNVTIGSSTDLTFPATATYAVICAVGGSLYYTYDGTTPSSTNYAGTLAAGAMLPVQGKEALDAIKVQGTSMSVSYWS